MAPSHRSPPRTRRPTSSPQRRPRPSRVSLPGTHDCNAAVMGSTSASGNTRTVVTPRSSSLAVTAPSLHARAFDIAPIAMAILDTELRYQHVNRAMVVLNGLSAEEHVGRRISEVFPDLGASLLATLAAVAAS